MESIVRNLFRLSIVIIFLFTGNFANAAPAVRLVVNCVPDVVGPPATTCFNHLLGQPFTFFVVAVDSNNQIATNYTGTVNITANDPAATLPSPHTFTAGDNSVFQFTITINSLPVGGGNPVPVPVTATDTNGITGSQAFSIALGSLPNAQSVPTLSTEFEIVLIVLLGFAAMLARRKMHES